MSSIPLPALGVQQPQQPDVLTQYGKLAQLRAMQQDAQQRASLYPIQQQTAQLQLEKEQRDANDQKALSAAMQEWAQPKSPKVSTSTGAITDPQTGEKIIGGSPLTVQGPPGAGTQDASSGSMPNYDDLVALAKQHGASFNAIQGLQTSILNMKDKATSIVKNDAQAGSANANAMKVKNGMLTDAMTGVAALPDAQLAQGLLSASQQLAQQGLLDPQHVQMAQQLAQSGDPAEIRRALTTQIAGMGGFSKMIEDAQKAEDLKQKQGKLDPNSPLYEPSSAAVALGTAPGAAAIQASGTGAQADSRFRNILMNQRLGRPVTPEDQAFVTAYKQQKELVPAYNFTLQNAGAAGSPGQPSAIAKGLADGSVKWQDVVSARTPMQVKQQLLSEVKAINPNFNSGDFTVEQKAREAFTSGNYSQQLNSINTAREHMKTFTSLADALDNGNVQALNAAGNAIGMQFGSDKATNFNIAKQAFSAEVAKAFSGAGVTEGDRKEIGDKISAASSPTQLRGAAATADALLAGKQKALQQTYNQSQQGNPNFGGGNQPASGGNQQGDGFWNQIPGAVPHQ